MKVIFDFDDVIFNAKGLKDVIFSTLTQRGYEQVSQKYEMRRQGKSPFSLYSFIRYITAETSEANVTALYDEIMSACGMLINHEVASLIMRLGKENCYIVTNGDDLFQRDKIERSIGLDAVQEVFIVPGGKAETIVMLCERHGNEPVIFVDDKPEFINETYAKECQNLKMVLFNENGLADLRAEIEASRIAENLVEKDDFLSNQTLRKTRENPANDPTHNIISQPQNIGPSFH